MSLARSDDGFLDRLEHRSAEQRAADLQATLAAKQRLLTNPSLLESLRVKLAELRQKDREGRS